MGIPSKNDFEGLCLVILDVTSDSSLYFVFVLERGSASAMTDCLRSSQRYYNLINRIIGSLARNWSKTMTIRHRGLRAFPLQPLRSDHICQRATNAVLIIESAMTVRSYTYKHITHALSPKG
jgi:hypothetical protein